MGRRNAVHFQIVHVYRGNPEENGTNFAQVVPFVVGSGQIFDQLVEVPHEKFWRGLKQRTYVKSFK